MSKIKIILFVLISLFGLTLFVTLLNYRLISINKEKNRFLYSENNRLKSENKELTQSKLVLEKQCKLLRQNLQIAENKVTIFRIESGKGSLKCLNLQTELNYKENLIRDLRDQIAAKDLQIHDIEIGIIPTNQNDQINPSNQESEEKDIIIHGLEEKISMLEMQIKEFYKKGKHCDKIGHIIAINSAWNFVVTDLGEKSGLSNNLILLVKRNGKTIGKVRITSIENKTSIADIIPHTGITPLQIGDEITPYDH